LKGISTSTLRRYIKAKKISYKIENGRYLLMADATIPDISTATTAPQRSQSLNPRSWDGARDMSTQGRIEELELKLIRAQEQINELKMLVAIYEEKLAHLDL
jgi:hypothetical protein